MGCQRGDTVYKEGAKVEFYSWGQFYPGRVKRDRGDCTYDIDCDDGQQETLVPVNNIRLMDDPGHGGDGKAVAVDTGHADVVQLLLSAGANIEAADKVILMIHYCMAV